MCLSGQKIINWSAKQLYNSLKTTKCLGKMCDTYINKNITLYRNISKSIIVIFTYVIVYKMPCFIAQKR